MVNNTLEQHRELIARHSYCWWGWWRRPEEDAHSDVWDELEERLRDGPVNVGLFDSAGDDKGGEERYFSQKSIESVRDLMSGGLGPLRMSTSELEKVPELYRHHPFSSAWMKIESIGLDIPGILERLSYMGAPNLPTIGSKEKKAFQKKAIAGAEDSLVEM